MTNLNLLILVPLLSALALLFFRNLKEIRLAALIGSLVQLILCAGLLVSYLNERAAGNTSQMLFEYRHTWFSAFNISYYIGVDGISVVMLLLTALVVFTGVLVSWTMEQQSREFFFMLMLLSIGAYGFFISLDLFTMFFFLELAVIPKFMLIAIWGSGRKEYSALKLALMLMGGSSLVLVGILATYYSSGAGSGEHSFDLLKLAAKPLAANTQYIIFPFLFAGFGIFTALFPFHTWVPDGHSSAPTAGSMFLAGISMKLGAYGCLRVATYLMPEAAHYYSGVIILLATIAIIYGAFATLMQNDLKYINAYSSVSHCGFILLGIGMLNKTALEGAVMQMVSHGLMTALFFAVIGMLYERTHTRKLELLGGLLKVVPFLGVVYVIAGLCSLGLPGFSGFVSEMSIFVGSWQNPGTFNRIATILACASIVVTAVYILQATAKAVMGPLKQEAYLQIKDARWYEKLASVVLIVAILSIGLAPFWFTGLIKADTQVIMETIIRGVSLK
ncbi:MAG TPA: NADH-quinone oxidoreductase subunit M [Bacteroidia bacterium]|nr:NADH-quinone oxidoreductase subunit M [Bacteroidia bacterium]